MNPSKSDVILIPVILGIVIAFGKGAMSYREALVWMPLVTFVIWFIYLDYRGRF